MKKYKSSLPEITLKYKSGDQTKVKVISSKDAYEVFKGIYDADTLEIQESVVIIYLNRANNTIGWYKASTGGMHGSIIDNRLILAVGLQSGATGMIVSHNHPSGNKQPSKQDVEAMRSLRDAGNIIGINMLDSIIITSDGYMSMADEGLL